MLLGKLEIHLFSLELLFKSCVNKVIVPKMPMSLRARVAAFKARSRFARKKSFSSSRKPFRSARRKGFRGRLQKYNVHSYKRWATTQVIQTGSAVYSDTKVFTLDDTVNSSELTSLYDQYQITGVKMTFRLLTNPDMNTSLGSTTGTNSNNFYPSMWYCRDYDNSAAETISDLKQRNQTKQFTLLPNRTYSVFVRPAVRNQIYLDGVTTATSPLWQQWVDCSNSTVPHYGLKYAFDPTSTNANSWNIKLDFQYYLKFKNAR